MKHLFLCAALTITALAVIASCDTESRTEPALGRGLSDGDFAQASPAFQDGGYTVTSYLDFDPLYQFGKTGGSVLLRSDPDVGLWGEDYYGYWAEPFALDGNSLSYIIGLTHTTYDFEPLADGSVDIVKTLVVQPYLGGSPTTTVTEVGNAVLTGPAPVPCPDQDGDNETDVTCGGADCNDDDPTVYPWAREICRDGIDQDCSGSDASCDCYNHRGRFRACR
jgi:hypothetical protein